MNRTIVPNFDVSFKNNHVVYETFIKCTIKDYEFNTSYNPTLLSGSQGVMTPFSSSVSSSIVYVTSQDSYGILKDFATGSISGSEFSPYVSTVGLYNDAQDLIAVAKMSEPIPISSNTDQTFLIKWDMNFKDTPLSSICESYTVTYVFGGGDLYFDYINCDGSVISLGPITSGDQTFCAQPGSLVIYSGNYTLTNNGFCTT